MFYLANILWKRMMDKSEFWKILEIAKEQSKGNVEKQEELIRESLKTYSAEEIVEFFKLYLEVRILTVNVELRIAADLIQEGCSEDGFLDFQDWLIGQGKTTFYDALANPETLADVPNRAGSYRLSLFGCIARAYEEKTDQELPDFEVYVSKEQEDEFTKFLEQGYDDELYEAKYPRLAAKGRENTELRYRNDFEV